MAATAGPRTSTLLSRHWSSAFPRPFHLSSIPNPPVMPTRPSTMISLRWLRARSSWPGTGRNLCTSQPAVSSGFICLSPNPMLPIASTRMRQATPFFARSVMAAISLREVSLSDQMKDTMWTFFLAPRISSMAASKTFPLLTNSTWLPGSSRTPTVW